VVVGLLFVKLVFEMSVPEEIVVVKSADGKRKKRRKTVEFDGDSDEEAQQLIDEAENEQGNDNDAGPAAGMSNIRMQSTCLIN